MDIFFVSGPKTPFPVSSGAYDHKLSLSFPRGGGPLSI